MTSIGIIRRTLALIFISMVVSEATTSARQFTQNGVGAVPRTVNDKLSERLSAKDFGAVGDGVTDDTAAIQAAVNAAAISGTCVYFEAVGSTPAVYEISSITMSAGQKVCLKGPGIGLVVLRHRAGSTASMLTSGTDTLASFELSDLTVDGHQGVGGVTNRFVSAIEIYTDTGSIHDAEFKNTMYAGIRLWAVTYNFSIRNNWMHDFALHGPNPTEGTAAILINKAVASDGVVNVAHNSIWMTTPPVGGGNSVGGIVISPAVDKKQMALVTANALWNMGQEIFHEQQGPIACDRNCDGTKIIGNAIYNSYYNPIVVQRANNFEVANNLISGEGTFNTDAVGAIQLGGQQTDNLVPMHAGSVHHNIIENVPHLIAIVANYDAGGEMTDLAITDNKVTNALGGTDSRNVLGHLQFTGNTFTNIIGSATPQYAGLRVRNGSPQGGPALFVDFSNNYFDGMGERPLYVNDSSSVQEIYVNARGNYYRNVKSAGLTIRYVVYANVEGNTSVGAPATVLDIQHCLSVRLAHNYAENTGTTVAHNTSVVDFDNSWTTTTTTGSALTLGALTAGSVTLASATVSGNQVVNGSATMGSAIVTGSARMGSSTVTGNAVVDGSVTAGSAIVTGSARMGSSTVTGNAVVNGLATMGSAIVTGSATMGSAIVTGNQVVTGPATFSGSLISNRGIDSSSSTAGWGVGAAPSTSATLVIDRFVGNSSRAAEFNFVKGLNSGFALTGNITNQRDWFLQGSTFTGSGGARTITNYATLYIDSAATAGANAAITNNYALWVRSGTSRFGGDVGIGTSGITFSATAPTVASGFGTAPIVAAGSTTVTWTITVTTASGESSGVLNLPAAANGWRCTASNRSRPGPTKLGMSDMTTTTATITQYSQTTGDPAPFFDGDMIDGGCSAR